MKEKLSSNARRWLNGLVVHLRKESTAKHFNITDWYYGPRLDWRSSAPQSLRRIARKDESGDCGATACAIGWLPALFPRSFRWVNGAVVSLTLGIGMSDAGAADVFGISESEYYWIFMPHSYTDTFVTSKEVAIRIEGVLKDYGSLDKE